MRRSACFGRCLLLGPTESMPPGGTPRHLQRWTSWNPRATCAQPDPIERPLHSSANACRHCGPGKGRSWPAQASQSDRLEAKLCPSKSTRRFLPHALRLARAALPHRPLPRRTNMHQDARCCERSTSPVLPHMEEGRFAKLNQKHRLRNRLPAPAQVRRCTSADALCETAVLSSKATRMPGASNPCNRGRLRPLKKESMRWHGAQSVHALYNDARATANPKHNKYPVRKHNYESPSSRQHACDDKLAWRCQLDGHHA